jgi:PAS domain S-box-containing protein
MFTRSLLQHLPKLASLTEPLLWRIVDRQPLTVDPEMPVAAVISLMSQARGRNCVLPNAEPAPGLDIEIAAPHSSALVVVGEPQHQRLVGIFTERDLVGLTASQRDLQGVKVGEVMSTELQTLVLSEELTVMSALAIFQQHRIEHLPILDDRQQLIGIVTAEHIRKALQPVNLLKFRSVAESMTDEVVRAAPTTPMLEIARMMAARDVSAIAIMSEDLPLQPVGIITEQDIVQYRALDLDLDRLVAQTVMSSPLFCVQPSDSLWSAQQIMQTNNIRRLVVTNECGELVGMLTQSNLLQLLDPIEMLYLVEKLQTEMEQRAAELERSNRELQQEVIKRQQVEDELEQRVASRTAELALRTQQLQAEIAKYQFQKSALDRSAIVAMTDRHGIITDVNDQFCQISQYTAEELLGQTHRMINSGEHPPEFFQELWATITSGQIWRGEIKNRAKDGSYYWVATTIVPFLDDRGVPFQYLAIRFDITEQQAALRERKQAEESLRQSEQKFRAIFDSTFQFVGLLDTAGNILEANRTALDAIGVTAAQVIGQPFWTTPWWTHSPDLQVQLRQAIDRAATGELARFEAKHFLADGSHVIVDFSLSPIFDNTGKVVMLIPEGRDITARKRVELALQESESRFRALLSAAPVGIFQSNLAGDCLFVNQQCTRLMGRSETEVLGQGWLDTIHPADLDRLLQAWHEAVRAENEYTLEYRLLTPQGRVNWVSSSAIPIRDEAGTVTGYLGTMVNISDRKAGEQKIQEQAALLDVATDAIFVRDLYGQIQFWNHGAQRIYGWSADEAIGQTTAQLFYPDSSPEVAIETAFRTVLTLGSWQGELHKLSKSGQKVIVESRWTLVPDETGQPRAILSVDTDITEKKLLEQQFLRAQRLESLGSLASGIAHDLNNVLTPILGAAQLLPLTLPSLDDRNRRLLNMLIESSKRGSGLVKQILTFARGMDGERTTIQARHILAEIISVARQTFPKSIGIRLNLAKEDLWLVNVDATQIHQVLMNLFVNARDAMPDGGEIVATAENITIDADYTRRHLQPPVGSYLKISVSDTGIGMTDELLDRIFDPFFTTKETGTGLGLSTVLGIVKAHGGTIDVQSQVGRGTCFNIYLPALDSREAESQTADAIVYDGKGQLILVVDDEVAVREITKESLEAYNYRVVLASDGIEAIDIYAQNHHSIAIVLIDMMMPNLDTPTTIQALRRIDPAVKIAIMSGLVGDAADVEHRDRSASEIPGVGAFLTKPFATADMLQALADLQLDRSSLA